MTVSVIVPAYNEEKYIKKCLDSITHQADPADEILVIDNNSTDKTAQIANDFPQVRVIEEKKQGIIAARNRGFNESTSDIIVRTDADTIVPRDWVKRIKIDFKKSSVDAVSGPAIFGSKMSLPLVNLLVFRANRKILRHDAMYGPNLALTKKMWEKIKDEVCKSEKLVHEDLDLAIHVGKHGKILFDPKLVVKTSARRVRKPSSMFGDYLYKWYVTFSQHDRGAVRILKDFIPDDFS